MHEQFCIWLLHTLFNSASKYIKIRASQNIINFQVIGCLLLRNLFLSCLLLLPSEEIATILVHEVFELGTPI